MILFIFIWVLIQGCNTKVEGCLDPQAFNFDLSAEKACGDCCEYPKLSISLSQKWNDLNVTLPDTLSDIHQRQYVIEDIKYFLSCWKWTDAADHVFTIDSTTVACGATTVNYIPDHLLADARQFVYTIGPFRRSALMDSLYFKLGLPEELSCIDHSDPELPVALRDVSPLWDSTAHQSNTVRIILKKDSLLEVRDTLFLNLTKSSALDYALEFQRGINTQLKLTVNYVGWFTEVDIDNLNSFATSIQNGFPNSIFRTP